MPLTLFIIYSVTVITWYVFSGTESIKMNYRKKHADSRIFGRTVDGKFLPKAVVKKHHRRESQSKNLLPIITKSVATHAVSALGRMPPDYENDQYSEYSPMCKDSDNSNMSCDKPGGCQIQG